MNEQDVIKNHDLILNRLLEYRKSNPDFTFSLRQKDSVQSDKKRLINGYWFTGTDRYLFIGLIKKGDSSNKTKQIGFVLNGPEDLNNNPNLEVVWKGESDQKYIDLYEDIVKSVSGFNRLQNRKYQKYYSKSFFEGFDEFFKTDYPVIMDLIKKHNLEKELLVPEDNFKEALGKIESIRKNPQLKKDINSEDSYTALNTILYGPPGTGKTYNVINKAVELIDGECSAERDEVIERYNELKDKGQIDFITFHQSYSYEEFIEGIKPFENDGGIIYSLVSGVFKSICDRALEKNVSDNFNEKYEQFINDVIEGGTIELKTPSQKKPFTVRINSSGNCVAIPQTETGTEMVVTRDMLRNYIMDGVIRDWKPYTVGISNYIKEKYNVIVSSVDSVDRNFVLIIDEINRGNISKIFGELITLIEEDKRLGAESELTVTLPYSKEKFGVPSNLYIVGTMNTADRSIALMDTALRRRFTFQEMMPEPELLNIIQDKEKEEEYKKAVRENPAVGNESDLVIAVNGMAINLRLILSKINERIEFLYDRDHTIGHAYFIGLKNGERSDEDKYEELCSIFSTKIIPLLQEYFYEDWEKIQLVLGDHYKQLKGGEKDTSSFEDEINKTRFIQSRLFSEKAVLGFDHEDYEDRVTYRVNPELNGCCIDAGAFLKIYK